MYSGKQLTKVITTTFHRNSVDIRKVSSEKEKKVLNFNEMTTIFGASALYLTR